MNRWPNPKIYTIINGKTFIVIARFNLAYQNVSIYYNERSGDYYYSINDETDIQVLNAEMVQSIIFSMSHEIEYLTGQLSSMDIGLNTLEKIDAELLNKIPPVQRGKVFKQEPEPEPVKNRLSDEEDCINSVVKMLRKIIDDALIAEMIKQHKNPTVGKVNKPNTVPSDVVNTESYPYNNSINNGTNGFEERPHHVKDIPQEMSDIIKFVFGENFEVVKKQIDAKKTNKDPQDPQEKINPNKNYKCPDEYKVDLEKRRGKIDPFF